MIILLDTSTPVCKLTLVDGDTRMHDEWEAGRGLAKGLLKYLQTQLSARNFTWSDITAIGAFEGPGSFTGLRIGLTVLNTIADSEHIPIVGACGDHWIEEALQKIHDGQNSKMVLPFYGHDAHITTPKK